MESTVLALGGQESSGGVLMTLAPERPGSVAPTVEALQRAVEECRRRVGARVPAEHLVDDVLSLTLIEAWKKLATFDPARGQVEAWVWGICHNMIRKVLADANRVRFIPDEADATRVQSQRRYMDPQVLVMERYDRADLMQRVAGFVGDEDWDVMLDLALSGEHPKDVAHRHGISLRKVQLLRQRCEAIARVVRVAQRVPLPASHDALRAAAAACVPADVFDADKVLPFLLQGGHESRSMDELAHDLGLTASTAHRVVKQVRELLDIAITVLDQRSLAREFSL